MSIITKITFKDEGEIQGEPIGQVTLSIDGRPEVSYGWLKLSQAARFADSYGLTLERG